VRTRIGLLELRAGRLDAAERDFDESLALHPTASAWIAKGYVAAKRDRFADALASYDRAISVDPRNVEALLQSAYAQLQLGHRPEASERIARGLAIEPDNAKLRALLDSAH
jgi:tetratricopeptide (TPR) repeat protein